MTPPPCNTYVPGVDAPSLQKRLHKHARAFGTQHERRKRRTKDESRAGREDAPSSTFQKPDKPIPYATLPPSSHVCHSYSSSTKFTAAAGFAFERGIFYATKEVHHHPSVPALFTSTSGYTTSHCLLPSLSHLPFPYLPPQSPVQWR